MKIGQMPLKNMEYMLKFCIVMKILISVYFS